MVWLTASSVPRVAATDRAATSLRPGRHCRRTFSPQPHTCQGTCPATSRLRLPNLGGQSPKSSSVGEPGELTLVCSHPFRQVLQYTVVEVTPITVAFSGSVRVTRCRRSRCHQYRIAHYMNRLISLRRISFLSRVCVYRARPPPVLLGAVTRRSPTGVVAAQSVCPGRPSAGPHSALLRGLLAVLRELVSFPHCLQPPVG